MIKVYVANLGKYNEGELVGEWLSLPADQDEINEMFARIKLGTIDDEGEYTHGFVEQWTRGGVTYDTVYEEHAIHDYETEIDGIKISEYDSLSNLNELAERLDALDKWEIQVLEAAIEVEGSSDIESILDNLDDYHLIDAHSDEDLGYYYADECGCIDIPDSVKFYFDYEAYGRDIRINSSGDFTQHGFLERH